MRPSHDFWRSILAVAACLVVGLGAGSARAQDEGGWFDERERERPPLRIQGSGPYDPPPPDFRSEPPRRNAEREEDAAPPESEASDDREDDAEAQTRALSEFSPHLARYGYWVDDPVYGRVWVPTRSVVGSDFSPYVTGGHWELTVDDEWLWVSDYPFGWITFHYGRWVWAGGPGWVWVPGYRYAPAWVDFRIGAAGYIGWGPLPAYYAWTNGVYVSIGVRRPLPFIFCPTTYVFSPSLHRHVIRDRYRVRSIAADTWRYRPHRAGSFSRVVRGPTPDEARIPRRSLPERRSIARPRRAESFERSGRDASATLRQQSYQRQESAPRFDQRSLSSARRANPGRSAAPGWQDADDASPRSFSSARRADRGERAARRAPDTSSMRRATPPSSRDARPREWFDDSSGRHRATPGRTPQRGFQNRAPAPRGSIDAGRPPAKSAPKGSPKARAREMKLPSDAENTLRRSDRPEGSERSYTPARRSNSYTPAARSKSRSQQRATTPRTQHRGERESRGNRR